MNQALSKSATCELYDMDHTECLYNQSLGFLYEQVSLARKNQPDQESVDLAVALIEQAKQYDIHQAYHLLEKPFKGKILRNFDNPTIFENSHLIGQTWADDAVTPLKKGETWNAGRRVTNMRIAFAADEDNLPVNPYMRHGVKGRIAGLYGPNHAVDIGLLRVMENKEGKPALHALGIIRQDNGKPALCGGFTNFTKDEKGIYQYGLPEIANSQTHEFFEELVSGSIDLMPEYAEGLEQEISEHIAELEKKQGKKLLPRDIQEIANQITTQRKLKQVAIEDPEFLQTMETVFKIATPCYAGPVLSSGRNTDCSWMETYLSSTMLDEQKWAEIKSKGKFDYDFKAGDDARAALWYEIGPDLMGSAMGSHRAFFAYLLSSYLLTQPHDEPDILACIKQQAKDVLECLTSTPSTVDKPVRQTWIF